MSKPFPLTRRALGVSSVAVLAASIFHFGTHTIREAKLFLAAQGITVRLCPER